jgi:hypothetical protein
MEVVVEFNLFNFGKQNGSWWMDFFLTKFVWKRYDAELGIFRLSYNHGKWDWDILGIGELIHMWKSR